MADKKTYLINLGGGLGIYSYPAVDIEHARAYAKKRWGKKVLSVKKRGW